MTRKVHSLDQWISYTVVSFTYDPKYLIHRLTFQWLYPHRLFGPIDAFDWFDVDCVFVNCGNVGEKVGLISFSSWMNQGRHNSEIFWNQNLFYTQLTYTKCLNVALWFEDKIWIAICDTLVAILAPPVSCLKSFTFFKLQGNRLKWYKILMIFRSKYPYCLQSLVFLKQMICIYRKLCIIVEKFPKTGNGWKICF